MWRLGVIVKKRSTKLDCCGVQGCNHLVHGRGLCVTHLRRMRIFGSTGGPTARVLARKRYRMVKRPGHPLANSETGRVYAHRVVLFDSTDCGFGIWPCFWCGAPVQWTTTRPIPSNALFVDHLDRDRQNNDPRNLVPSCNKCNAARNSRRIRPMTSIYSAGEAHFPLDPFAWEGATEQVIS